MGLLDRRVARDEPFEHATRPDIGELGRTEHVKRLHDGAPPNRAHQGARELLFLASQKLAEAPPPPAVEEMPVYRAPADESDFSITREADGGYRVTGAKSERAAKMTYWEYDEAVARFQKILEALGIYQALAESGIQEGDTVYIGDYELEWAD